MKSGRIVLSLFACAALAALALPASADMYIKQASHTDGFTTQGQTVPAQEDTIIIWLTETKARSESADATAILDADKQMMYLIDNEKKTYMELPLSALGDMTAMMNLEGEEAEMMKEQMKAMAAMMTVSATVTPTDETKEIRGYKCKKYLVDMKMGMINAKTEHWVTQDVKADWTLFKNLSIAKMLLMPGAQEMMKEMEKMDGFPILMEGSTLMMGTTIKTRSEALVIEERDAPAGTFDIPKDYVKEPFKIPMGR